MPATRRHAFTLLAAPLLAATLLGAPPAQAQRVTGSGQLATEARTLPEFHAVELSGSMDLSLRQGAQEVKVTVDDNLRELLETVVEERNGTPTLLVRWKRGTSLSTRSRIAVAVAVPRLTAVSASGSGDIRLEPFNTPSLRVALSGSGDARLAGLTTGELAISISGSGDVTYTGNPALRSSVAGSGSVTRR